MSEDLKAANGQEQHDAPVPQKDEEELLFTERPQGREDESFALRHLRPTSALEMFDRTFDVWRRQSLQFLMLGALTALPALVVDLVIVWRTSQEPTLSPLDFAPWAFLAFVLQLLPVTAILRVAFATLVWPESQSQRLRARSIWWSYPRVILTVLLTIFGAALIMNLGLVAMEALAPGLLSLIAAIGAVAAVFVFSANMMPAFVLVGVGLEEMGRAWRASWRLMMRTRFGNSWWRENPYWRLVLLLVFPVICRGLLALGLRIAYWMDTGTWLGFAEMPPIFAVLEVAVSAVAACFLVPWLCIALVSLTVELSIRFVALDFQLRMGGIREVDSARVLE